MENQSELIQSYLQESKKMEEIIKHIAEMLLPVFGALLTALATYGSNLVIKRLGIKLEEDHQRMLRSVIRSGIAGAEEWAYRKAKIEGNPVEGSKKAIWVHERVKKAFPKLSPDELDLLIDEELAKMKSVGSTGEKRLDV